MKEKTKNILTVCLIATLLLGFFILCAAGPERPASQSERRPLATMPELTGETLSNGEFMQKFEDAATDQFPLRDAFRTLKAACVYYLFGQMDNNGVYLKDGHASKLEYPMDEASLNTAAEKFGYICEKYISGTGASVYFSVIPDKNAFMAEKNGYPALDYDEFIGAFRDKASFMEYIDITDLLELSDYYRTDAHWRQEKIADVAARLAECMGAELSGVYEKQLVTDAFYGAYYGQAALPMPPEPLYCLTNDVIDACTVYDFETDSTLPVYTLEKAEGQDAYEVFLAGSKSLLTIENPNAATDRELIIFRDSFGSSLAPLLVEGYSRVTLVDIRYVSPSLLNNWIVFGEQDVLFIYSTLLLNNSVTLK